MQEMPQPQFNRWRDTSRRKKTFASCKGLSSRKPVGATRDMYSWYYNQKTEVRVRELTPSYTKFLKRILNICPCCGLKPKEKNRRICKHCRHILRDHKRKKRAIFSTIPEDINNALDLLVQELKRTGRW